MRPKPPNWWRHLRATGIPWKPEGFKRVLRFPWPNRRELARASRTLPGGWLATLERHGELARPRARRGWLARLFGR